MNHILFKGILIVILSFLYGCGEGGSEGDNDSNIFNDTVNLSGDGTLRIIGTISYERVQPQHSGTFTRLNYNNITNEKAKEVVVQAIDNTGKTIAATTTDSNGDYSLTGIPESTFLKIRVYAKLLKPSVWDVKVVDNTNGNSQYIIEGSLANTGTSSTRRDLKASLSDDGSAPFAMLDSIYQAMKKVQSADSNVEFPPLQVNWSVNNVPTGTSRPADGLLLSTVYENRNIYVLGKKSVDADEFDHHVIIHEWGHYFEDVFSRADSIGGSHTSGNYLDIRLSFGEGWGNAISAIATDDPIYFDTRVDGKEGWNMNIETASKNTPGFFSEASIQRILYDLYDSNDDGADTLSLGFAPLYNVFIGAEKTTPAFTSIFSFITALKKENNSNSNKIDAIVGNEDISTITDIYGSNRSDTVDFELNSNVLPLYTSLDVGNTLNQCTINTYGLYNKLGTNKYIRFSISSSGEHTITLRQTNGTNATPDFQLYKTGTKEALVETNNRVLQNLSKSVNLPVGDYLLNVRDRSGLARACFDISIN